MATTEVLITVHPEPLAAAGLSAGSQEIELRAVVSFPDTDHVRLTLHGPQDRLDALAAALAGGSVTLPGQTAAIVTQPAPGDEKPERGPNITPPSVGPAAPPPPDAKPPVNAEPALEVTPRPPARKRGRPRKNPPPAAAA